MVHSKFEPLTIWQVVAVMNKSAVSCLSTIARSYHQSFRAGPGHRPAWLVWYYEDRPPRRTAHLCMMHGMVVNSTRGKCIPPIVPSASSQVVTIAYRPSQRPLSIVAAKAKGGSQVLTCQGGWKLEIEAFSIFGQLWFDFQEHKLHILESVHVFQPFVWFSNLKNSPKLV